MSKEAALKLVTTAENDSELLSRLKAVETPQDLLAIGLELGYEFTEEELITVLQEKGIQFNQDDLSEEELEGIAGGKGEPTYSNIEDNSKRYAPTYADTFKNDSTKGVKRRRRR